MEKFDLTLLSPYSKELPHLLGGFNRACIIPAEQRPAWAKQERRNILRDGWYVNTPVGRRGDGETVEDHVRHLKILIDRYFPTDLREEAKTYAEYHDDHETLAHALIDGDRRDLNPLFNKTSYKISPQDKALIEEMARAILFESMPDLKDNLDTYPNSASDAARLFSALDKICVMWRCADFVESGKYHHSDFQAYWDYWTPENVRKKCSGLLGDVYETELWPRVKALSM